MVSPWVESGSVYNDEYRHTSLIATLTKTWGLGEPFSQRDASARTFEHVFTLDVPRDVKTWATVKALPVPAWTMDHNIVSRGLSTLGEATGHGLIAKAREMEMKLPVELDNPGTALTPRAIVDVLRAIASHFFPLLAGGVKDLG
jgi:phospholipase C